MLAPNRTKEIEEPSTASAPDQPKSRAEYPVPFEEIQDIESAIINSTKYSPEQQRLLLDMVTSIKVIEDQITYAKQHVKDFDVNSFKPELDRLRSELYRIDALSKDAQLEDPSILQAKERELLLMSRDTKTRTFQTLSDLRTTSRILETENSKPNSSESARATLKKQLSEKLREMITNAPIEESKKDAFIESLPNAVEAATKVTEAKGPGIFEKMLIWFNTTVLKKDYTWLNKYLAKTEAFKTEKNPEKKNEAINKYIQENHKELYSDAEKKKLISKKTTNEVLPSAKEPEEKQEQAPLATTNSTPDVASTPSQEKQASTYIQNLEQQEGSEKALEALKSHVEQNSYTNAQEKINGFIDSLIAEDKSADPVKKVTTLTASLENRILNKNVNVTKEMVEMFYSRLMPGIEQNASAEADATQFRIKEEVALNKGIILNLIKHRENQCNMMITIQEEASEKATAAGLTGEALAKEVDNLVRGVMVDKVANFVLSKQLVENETDFRANLKEYMDAGAIDVSFATDKHGGGYPLITAHSYINKNGVEISGKEILNELTGGKKQQDKSKLAAGYHMTVGEAGIDPETGTWMPNELEMVFVAKDKDIPIEFDKILRHELTHAAHAASKAARLSALRGRMESATLSPRSSLKGPIDKLSSLTNVSPEIINAGIKRFMFSDAPEGPRKDPANAEFLRLIGSNASDPEIVNLLNTLEKRNQTYVNKLRNGWNRPLDEVAAKAADATEAVTLSELDIKKFDSNNEVHRTALGVMRMINQYVDINGRARPEEKARLLDNQAFVGRYFGAGIGNDQAEGGVERIFDKFVEAIKANPNDPNIPEDIKEVQQICLDLGIINQSKMSEEGINQQSDILTESYVRYIENAVSTNGNKQTITTEQQQVLKQSFSQLIDGKVDFIANPESRTAIIKKIEALFPGMSLPYLQYVTPELAQVVNMFIDPPNTKSDYDENGYQYELDDDPANRYRDCIHPLAPIRYSARFGANASLYGPVRKKDIGGEDKMGGKVHLGFRITHPKDMGPSILRWGGLNKKVLVDSFGIGTDEFRADGCDGLEGLYFLTGISLHKMPWLANLDAYWSKLHLPGPLGNLDKKAWVPSSVLAPSVDAYTQGVLGSIFGRLTAEHFYDPQALVKLIIELGGYKYDAQGQPSLDRTTYALKHDSYRLNSELAEFINNDLKEIYAGNPNERALLIDRLSKDKMIDPKTNRMVDVEYRNGAIYEVGTDNLIQKGGLVIGQMTENALKEMEEIMVYYKNDRSKEPLWKLGREMKDFTTKMGVPEDVIKQRDKYRTIANQMMLEDAKRRSTGGAGYTISDLIIELERAQNAPTGSIYDEKTGKVNQAMVDRYKNQKVNIGGEEIEVKFVKEFLKDFSLARSQKVLTVGVWEKGPDIKTEDENGNPISSILNPEKIIEEFSALGPGDKEEIPIPSNENSETEYKSFLIDKKNNKKYYFHRNDRGQVFIKEVKSQEWKYRKDAKLTFFFKQSGYSFTLDPIKGLPPEILLRYYGKKNKYKVWSADGKKQLDVEGRDDYDTEQGQMFDDVYDELTKIKQGKELSYKYSVKLYSLDKYRDQSKVLKEYYEGLMLIESTVRKAIIAMTVIGCLFPPLGMLANPALILGTLAWSLAGQPFLERAANGWKARMMAAIEAKDAISGASSLFFGLANESKPPSFGELDLANSEFENVKVKYRSVLKNFNDGAKWNTNMFTNLFSTAWDKIGAKPSVSLF